MQFNQWLFEWALRLPQTASGPMRDALQRLARAILNWYAKLSADPIVYYQMNRMKLALPLTHALPHIHLRYPDYSWNLGRIAHLVQTKYPDARMIDVGANIGDTVAIVHASSPMPMLCIDGDSRYFELLQRNMQQFEHIATEQAFLSSGRDRIPATLTSRDGTGHLAGDEQGSTSVYALEDILDLHPKFKSAKILKVDTDGFDTLILKGAIAHLERAKAIVYFEYDPYFYLPNDPAGFEIFSELRAIGYRSAIFFRNTGAFHAEAWLEDDTKLRALHAEACGHGGKLYFDVCVFHRCDDDLHNLVVTSESSRDAA